MKQKLVLLLAFLMLGIGSAMAQKRVTGRVVDTNGEPVAGATVRVAGTKIVALTDANGNYTLSNVPASAKQISVSYIGMESQTVPVGTAKVTLQENTLGETIVVAYGQQKKTTFTGSAAVVGSAEIDKVQVTNAIDAMKGKAAGVQINTASGQPGSTPTIRIRGINTLTETDGARDPLIVVDGSPYNGSLNSINPADVASMTVLKDAQSTALYGARGGNGVILITTKKGRAGESARITVDAKWGSNSKGTPRYATIDNPAAYYEMWYKGIYNYAVSPTGSLQLSPEQAWIFANQNLTNNSEFGLGYNVYTLPEGQFMIGRNGKLNPNATLGRYITGTDGNRYYVTPDDWEDEAMSPSLRQEYTVTATGATEVSSFYASANYLDNQGITVGSDYRRFTARLNADYRVKPWLKVGVNMNYGHYIQNSLDDEGAASSGNLFSTLYMAPIYPMYIRDAQGRILYDENSHLNRHDYGDGALIGLQRPYLSLSNPLSDIQLNLNRREGNTFNGTGTFEVKLPADLKFHSINNVYLNEYRDNSTTNPYFGQYANEKGTVEMSHRRFWSYNYQQRLEWSRKFGRSDIQAMAGHEYYRTTSTYLYGSKSKMFSQENTELAGAVVLKSAASTKAEYNTESFFARVNYNFDEKYFASASYTRQASSKFHKDSRWGNFWALGAGWMINKERWFTARWVDELKLKASYGENGNDGIGSYLYTNYYSIINSNDEIALKPVSLGNKDITWEKNGKFNIGVDFSFFNGRLSGSAEYYSNRTKDMLAWFTLPTSFGYTGYYTNTGNIRNNGVEIDLRGEIIRKKDFSWSIYANITTNHNEVTMLPEERKKTELDGYRGYQSGGYFFAEGLSAYTRYGRKYAGVNPETGESQWWMTVNDYEMTQKLDAQGNPVFDAQGNPEMTQKLDENGQAILIGSHMEKTTAYGEATDYVLGDALPDFYGGFGTSLEWKGFDFSVDFQYQLGGKVYDSGYAGLMGCSAGKAIHQDMLKAWTPENTSSSIPRFQYNDAYMAASSDRFYTSASYLSLSNITLGYTLPRKWTDQLKIEGVRFYVVADNIWTWSKRQGLDPRQYITGQSNSEAYRSLRTVSGGVRLTF